MREEYISVGQMTANAVAQHLKDNHSGIDISQGYANVFEIHSKIDHMRDADHTHKP